MKLTKEEAIKRHRELWGWLAENPMKEKTDWPGWERYDAALNDCFLCEYTLGFRGNYSDKFSKCEHCPVWFKENGFSRGTVSYCLGGLFYGWTAATLPEERKRLAAIIRDLPEKQEVKLKPKFSIGDKVYPVSKTVPGFEDNIKEDVHWQKSEPRGYFFVTDIDECKTKSTGKTVYVCNFRKNTTIGNYFFESDLIPYVERPQNFAPENKTVAIANAKYIFNDSVTVCVISIGGHTYKGIAKCAPDDTFDEEFGKALAEMRAYKSAFEDAERTLLGR